MLTQRSFTLAAVLLPLSQQLEGQALSVDIAGHRALASSLRKLREKTGWLIAIEEPIRPVQQAPPTGSRARSTIHGNTVAPPAPEHLTLPSLAIQGRAREAVLDELLAAYHSQNLQNGDQNTRNGGDRYMRGAVGEVAVIQPAGPSLLSARIDIPRASRSPEEHLDAIAQAAGQRMNVVGQFDTGAFGFAFNRAFLGDDAAKLVWGTNGDMVARQALADLLQKSKTTTLWEVYCQVGMASSRSECTLNVTPLIVEVHDRNGKLTRRTLYFDRGRCQLRPKIPHSAGRKFPTLGKVVVYGFSW